MSTNVIAVIAALRVAVDEAEESDSYRWPVQCANRWINQLPGAWFGRWRHLKLTDDYLNGETRRDHFIGHVRATLAYLEANKDAIERLQPWHWPFTARSKHPHTEPIEADFTEIEPTGQRKIAKHPRSLRVIGR